MKKTNLIAISILFLSCALEGDSKPPLPTPLDVPVLGEMDAFLLDTLYESQETDAGLEDILSDSTFQALIERNELELFSGPMLGCLTDNSARVWVRTAGPATVQIVARDCGEEFALIQTEPKQTGPENDFAALLECSGQWQESIRG
jgi:alkaline phosphatase D